MTGIASHTAACKEGNDRRASACDKVGKRQRRPCLRPEAAALGRPWEEGEEEALWSRVPQQRVPWEEVAERMGRTKYAVKNKFRAMASRMRDSPSTGVRRPWTPEEVVTMLRLAEEGKDWESIAAALGDRTALGAYKKHREATQPEPKHEEEEDVMAAFCDMLGSASAEDLWFPTSRCDYPPEEVLLCVA